MGLSLSDAERFLDLEETITAIRVTQLQQGDLMVTQAEAINSIATRITDILADFRAFRDAMLAERENLSADGQAALDAANATITELDTEVGDADGSDTPPPPPPPPPPAPIP